MSRSTVLACLLVLGVLGPIASGCGPNHSRPGGDDDGTTDAGNGSGTSDAATCASEMVTAQQIPLDIFVMLDQSGSMTDAVSGGGTKWTAVTGALTAFVQQPNLDGVSIGMQFFGVPPAGGGTCSTLTCMVDADCGATACGPCEVGFCLGAITAGADSCNASDYAIPAVEIAPLPGVASAITASMATHSPTTGTPTSAALQGAIDHATSWAHNHAGDAVVVVLATDGDPQECDSNLSDIDQIAATAYAANPKIPTFVIGVGPDTANLNGIAVAGGTTSAFLVDTGGNVNQQFLDAMNVIRHAALGCVYQIPVPTSGTPNYQEVNVVFSPTGGGYQTFPYVANQAACPATGNAWYYDDPVNPTQIILCAAACATVEADSQGSVDITLGCATVIE